ncbi:amidohydrolase [Staphylococcus lutrae]|uniref:Amidohydrolase n=1 Tax=Staphylococcus lutrae TaxID=155085 RepID=A0AAC9WIR2_9STAP|nr:amidohydrolase [Staphylococcus lutrae]ARJ50534.1 amidohydrolase [Staphylococcus lutrae]PNZ37436.1 amidohydrolase [Staphylococcus lutrae]
MEPLRDKLFALLNDREEKMIEIRRHLHQHPELSFKEAETSAYLQSFYKDKDVKLHLNLNGQHGFVVEIQGNGPGKTIALRADFDALPIREEAAVDFRSDNDGVMHACGHDAHSAYLVMLADALIELKNEWSGTIKIVHQHAEEVPPGGALDILQSGVLDDVDEIYGIHLFPSIDTGIIEVLAGAAFAGRSNFDISIQGLGGHAAMPQHTKDALVAGAHLVTTLQTVVSRRTDPSESLVITVGAFEAPGGYNVIQDHVTLKGTIRYLNSDLKSFAKQEIQRIANGIAATFDVEVDVKVVDDYPTLYNDTQTTEAVKAALSNSEGQYFTTLQEGKKMMGSEDFAHYLTRIPGTFFIVGSRPDGMKTPYFNHHPKFVINEKSLLISAKSLGEVVLHRLTN